MREKSDRTTIDFQSKFDQNFTRQHHQPRRWWAKIQSETDQTPSSTRTLPNSDEIEIEIQLNFDRNRDATDGHDFAQFQLKPDQNPVNADLLEFIDPLNYNSVTDDNIPISKWQHYTSLTDA